MGKIFPFPGHILIMADGFDVGKKSEYGNIGIMLSMMKSLIGYENSETREDWNTKAWIPGGYNYWNTKAWEYENSGIREHQISLNPGKMKPMGEIGTRDFFWLICIKSCYRSDPSIESLGCAINQ